MQENNTTNNNLVFGDYSHEAFFVTGKVHNFTYANLASEMQQVWGELKANNYLQNVSNPGEKNLYAVYYNMNETGFQMLIGLVTTTKQENDELTTIEIPAQDYKYVEFDFSGPESVSPAWQKVNAVSRSEINRSFGYDLEIYAEDMKKFTIAVSVKK